MAILNWFNRQISDDIYKLTYQNTDIDKFILLEKSLSIILQLLASHKQTCNLNNLLSFIQDKIKEEKYKINNDSLVIITSKENRVPKNKDVSTAEIDINENLILDSGKNQENIIPDSNGQAFHSSPIFSILCFFAGAIIISLLNKIINQKADNLQETINTPLYGIYQAKKSCFIHQQMTYLSGRKSYLIMQLLVNNH
ncbi:hypothetical protein [Pasteurella bettyae]|uniref:hypothetical protein n=1 Tax=Pasteurella bettyae TaxID=752 RepID=UPI0011C0457A|nr:hypothetical protein [Pasteurella bettyae]